MKKCFLNILILFFCGSAVGVFFYTNTAEYKMQKFQNKYAGEITELKPIYKDATNYCNSENFVNRGEYTASMEEKIKKYPYKNYWFYMYIQNFCESLFDNLADKWNCVDEVMT